MMVCALHSFCRHPAIEHSDRSTTAALRRHPLSGNPLPFKNLGPMLFIACSSMQAVNHTRRFRASASKNRPKSRPTADTLVSRPASRDDVVGVPSTKALSNQSGLQTGVKPNAKTDLFFQQLLALVAPQNQHSLPSVSYPNRLRMARRGG